MPWFAAIGGTALVLMLCVGAGNAQDTNGTVESTTTTLSESASSMTFNGVALVPSALTPQDTIETASLSPSATKHPVNNIPGTLKNPKTPVVHEPTHVIVTPIVEMSSSSSDAQHPKVSTGTSSITQSGPGKSSITIAPVPTAVSPKQSIVIPTLKPTTTTTRPGSESPRPKMATAVSPKHSIVVPTLTSPGDDGATRSGPDGLPSDGLHGPKQPDVSSGRLILDGHLLEPGAAAVFINGQQVRLRRSGVLEINGSPSTTFAALADPSTGPASPESNSALASEGRSKDPNTESTDSSNGSGSSSSDMPANGSDDRTSEDTSSSSGQASDSNDAESGANPSSSKGSPSSNVPNSETTSSDSSSPTNASSEKGASKDSSAPKDDNIASGQSTLTTSNRESTATGTSSSKAAQHSGAATRDYKSTGIAFLLPLAGVAWSNLAPL